MSSKAYLRRASINEAQLMSEMKSWGKNKAMERTLHQRNAVMDKHLANKKKNQDYEKDLLSKNLEKNVMTKSMSTEDYLDRSQSKYSTWKERERERLERRYTNLNKAYMKEFKQLGLQDYIAPIKEIHRRRSESDINKEKVDVIDDKPEHPVTIPASESGANASAKGDTSQSSDNEAIANDTNAKANDIDEESKSCKEESEKDDTVGSMGVRNMIMRKQRRATITAISTKDRPIATNQRFDRRPSMQFSAIPYNFG